MNTDTCSAEAIVIDGVIETNNSEPGFRLLHAYGEHSLSTWLSIGRIGGATVRKVRATILPRHDGRDAPDILVNIENTPDADVFQILPESFETIDGHMHRLCDAVDNIQSPALRMFISNVFSLRPVYYWFWTSPASQHHHHDYRGGLADHTLEVAENVAQSPGLSATERDIGIAHALCHDLGKIWTYDEANTAANILGHELTALAELNEPLARLASDWPEASAAIRGLLAGRWKKNGGRPFLSVGKLVQAYDQASAEHDRIRTGHRSVLTVVSGNRA